MTVCAMALPSRPKRSLLKVIASICLCVSVVMVAANLSSGGGQKGVWIPQDSMATDGGEGVLEVFGSPAVTINITSLQPKPTTQQLVADSPPFQRQSQSVMQRTINAVDSYKKRRDLSVMDKGKALFSSVKTVLLQGITKKTLGTMIGLVAFVNVLSYRNDKIRYYSGEIHRKMGYSRHGVYLVSGFALGWMQSTGAPEGWTHHFSVFGVRNSIFMCALDLGVSILMRKQDWSYPGAL
eukprot:GHVQ01002429.1.p1 GENE.GHVQ01002429.1~~GHVQ01002429.1.p1  ORF type:complete len:238 (-),score=28.84 GHVQ01002429.1:184-897(-)